jgi:hypothetical protein
MLGRNDLKTPIPLTKRVFFKEVKNPIFATIRKPRKASELRENC